MKEILLIYTGGTIGMCENHDTGALENVDFDKILPMLHELKQFKLKIDTVTFNSPIDSSDMGPEQWKKIVRIIADNYSKYTGFVILHGTDTMAYTASALSFMLEGLNKPIVLTGSQLPIGKLRTDGRGNLITAIEIAAATNEDGTPKVPEVCIFFHDKLLRGNRTTKSSADAFDAFYSFNYSPLAFSAVNIDYNVKRILPYNAEARLIPHYEMDSNMAVISLFPGIQENVMRSMLSAEHLKGVILRTYGAGNAPTLPWISKVIGDAVSNGIVVVDITQCAGGNVVMDRYGTGLRLKEIGVIGGQDSTVEAALTKMMRLFGDKLPLDEIKRQMAISIAGEL